MRIYGKLKQHTIESFPIMMLSHLRARLHKVARRHFARDAYAGWDEELPGEGGDAPTELIGNATRRIFEWRCFAADYAHRRLSICGVITPITPREMSDISAIWLPPRRIMSKSPRADATMPHILDGDGPKNCRGTRFDFAAAS